MRLFAKPETPEADKVADTYQARCMALLATPKGCTKLAAELESQAAILETRSLELSAKLRAFTEADAKAAFKAYDPDRDLTRAAHNERVDAEARRLGNAELSNAMGLIARQRKHVDELAHSLARQKLLESDIPALIAADMKTARKAADDARKAVAERTARHDALQREVAGVQARLDELIAEIELKQAPQREALESARQALAAAIESGEVQAVEELAQRVQALESTVAAPRTDTLTAALRATLQARVSELERAQAAGENARLELARCERRVAHIAQDECSLALVKAAIASWRADDAVVQQGGRAERRDLDTIRFNDRRYSPTDGDVSSWILRDLAHPIEANDVLFEREATLD